MRQPEEVCHFSFTIDQGAEHRVISASPKEKEPCDNQVYKNMSKRRTRLGRQVRGDARHAEQEVTWQRRKQCLGPGCPSLGSHPSSRRLLLLDDLAGRAPPSTSCRAFDYRPGEETHQSLWLSGSPSVLQKQGQTHICKDHIYTCTSF